MVNAALVSGLNHPYGIAISGNDLFVTNFSGNTVGEYDATTGATINASLISGLSGPAGIALLDGDLLVVNSTSGTIGRYNATTGATVNAALISGLQNPQNIIVVSPPSPASFAPQKPTLAVRGKKKVETTKSVYVIKGTASANAGYVQVKVGSAKFKRAKGISAWSFKAHLASGVNHITVQAINGAGSSAAAKLTITRE